MYHGTDGYSQGRSPYEPVPAGATFSEYEQLSPWPHERTSSTGGGERRRYTQLYDERGYPVNPAAQQYGRNLRWAQNDVLSAVGVVERVVERRPSPSANLPGPFNERLERLEVEARAAHALTIATTITQDLSTWWVGTLRARILTFRIRDAVPFSQIVASQWQLLGPSSLYAGFPAHLMAAYGDAYGCQLSTWANYVLQRLWCRVPRPSTRKPTFFIHMWRYVRSFW